MSEPQSWTEHAPARAASVGRLTRQWCGQIDDDTSVVQPHSAPQDNIFGLQQRMGADLYRQEDFTSSEL